MGIIPIMHCFNNEFVIAAAVSFYSMLKNADSNYEYKLYVLHTDITKENQKKLSDMVDSFDNASLQFIDMNGKFDDLYNNTEKNVGFSKEVYYKMCAPSIFPMYDKLIITDVDVVFCGDISKSFILHNMDEDSYIAGVQCMAKKNSWIAKYLNQYEVDFSEEEIKKLIIGGGFLVYNLKKMRQDNIEKKMVEYAWSNSKRLIQMEQDVINLVCYPYIECLSPNTMICSYHYDMYKEKKDYFDDMHYDYDTVKDALKNPIQLHYAGAERKPWNNLTTTKGEVWMRYLSMTPFYMEFIEKYNLALNFEKRMKHVCTCTIPFWKKKFSIYRTYLK